MEMHRIYYNIYMHMFTKYIMMEVSELMLGLRSWR